MRKIIAIAGPAQAGKSTISAHLKTRGFTEDSFAAPIRQCVADILGVTLNELEVCKDFSCLSFIYTPRRMMQTLGTEWGRQMIQDDLWIVSLLGRIRHEPSKSFVIFDLRFENEAIALRDMGAKIWHIERAEVTITSNHVSENGVIRQPHDFVLLNNGTIDELHNHIDNLLREDE